MTKCLIIGGLGFIGTNLALSLLNLGYKVRILDNFSRVNRINFYKLSKCDDLEIMNGDIRVRKDISKALSDIDVVYNEASPQMQECDQDPNLCYEVNINGIIYLLEEINKKGIKRLIYSSSSSIYKENGTYSISESDEKLVRDYYSLSKEIAEKIIEFESRKHDLSYCIFRNSPVYGPWQCFKDGGSGITMKLIENLFFDSELTIFSEGKQKMDLLFVDDLVNINVLALRKGNGIYNLSTNRTNSINNIIYLIEKYSNRKCNINYCKDGITYERRFNNEKLKNEFKVDDFIYLEDGIMKTLNWFESNIKEIEKEVGIN